MCLPDGSEHSAQPRAAFTLHGFLRPCADSIGGQPPEPIDAVVPYSLRYVNAAH